MKRIAVIDLGTNTFHLLIVALFDNGQMEELYRERIFVKLAEDGIERIATAPFERGLAAMRHFKSIMEEHEIIKIRAFGTAALRTASNAREFIHKINEETGVQVDIVSGDEEALLIYQGVSQVVSFDDMNGLIMDIGGGSVEFILANQNGVIWSQSFPIGVAVLSRKFHQTDPISETEIQILNNFLTTTLQTLQEVLTSHTVDTLIGASGTFDVLEEILVAPTEKVLTSSFPSVKFIPLYDKLIISTLEERLQMENIPDSRAELIISALILIRYVLELTKAPLVTVSAYAMKEGILKSMKE